MNKTELIDAIAEEAGLSKADAKKALEAFLASIEKTLKKGDKISLVGFGSWSVSEKPAREGRNPRTGETMKIAESVVPKFKPGKALKDAVNK